MAEFRRRLAPKASPSCCVKVMAGIFSEHILGLPALHCPAEQAPSFGEEDLSRRGAEEEIAGKSSTGFQSPGCGPFCGARWQEKIEGHESPRSLKGRTGGEDSEEP